MSEACPNCNAPASPWRTADYIACRPRDADDTDIVVYVCGCASDQPAHITRRCVERQRAAALAICRRLVEWSEGANGTFRNLSWGLVNDLWAIIADARKLLERGGPQA